MPWRRRVATTTPVGCSTAEYTSPLAARQAPMQTQPVALSHKSAMPLRLGEGEVGPLPQRFRHSRPNSATVKEIGRFLGLPPPRAPRQEPFAISFPVAASEGLVAAHFEPKRRLAYFAIAYPRPESGTERGANRSAPCPGRAAPSRDGRATWNPPFRGSLTSKNRRRFVRAPPHASRTQTATVNALFPLRRKPRQQTSCEQRICLGAQGE